MNAPNATDNKIAIVHRLNELLGDSERRLTLDNFSGYRPVIETLFSFAEAIGVPGVDEIKTNYGLEVIQSVGQMTEGRLGYIRKHLQTLVDRVEEFDP